MNTLLKWVLPLVENAGQVALVAMLQGLCDAHKDSYVQLITGVYPLIDVQLEDYAKSTSTKVDDEVVTKLKNAMEQSALANGVTLPNLDAGGKND